MSDIPTYVPVIVGAVEMLAFVLAVGAVFWSQRSATNEFTKRMDAAEIQGAQWAETVIGLLASASVCTRNEAQFQIGLLRRELAGDDSISSDDAMTSARRLHARTDRRLNEVMLFSPNDNDREQAARHLEGGLPGPRVLNALELARTMWPNDANLLRSHETLRLRAESGPSSADQWNSAD